MSGRKKSKAQIAREYRQRHPEREERNQQRVRARSAASRQLARIHPDLFAPLYKAECERRGVTPFEAEPLPRGSAAPAYQREGYRKAKAAP